MFLEFVYNLPEKFRNITCKIQELPSKKPEMFLKNLEGKKNKRPRVVFYSMISYLEVQRAKHCTELNLF